MMANYLVISGGLSLGDFVMINTYILQLYAPLNFLGTFYRMIKQNMVDVEYIFELLHTNEFVREAAIPEKPVDGPGLITF